jgi:hypothetical protein
LIFEEGTLERRIVKLIIARLYKPMSVVFLIVVAASCAGTIAFNVRPLTAQSATPEFRAPAFEVVSVKPESKVVMDPENWGVTADGLRAFL